MGGVRLLKSKKTIISILSFTIIALNLISIVSTVNVAGSATLDPIPAWVSSDTDYSYCAAWGDVNNDGYLDLAYANDGQNDVYLNINGVMQTTPAWTSSDSRDTYEVAWGDVDNDGDLDLAAANFGLPWQNNVLYFNQYIETGGTVLLETSPSWISDDKSASRGLEFGDVDNDGDIDLAVGNSDQQDKIYKNHFIESGGSSTIETTASWNSAGNSKAYGVTWGDMNNDGYLDLAVANAWKENVVYLNLAGVLETNPSWQSSDDDYTGGLEWGDVDNDGDLDLAAANVWDINNVPTSNDVYYNINGMLESAPSWSSSDAALTFGIAWGDVDNDGYLDLAAGNHAGANTLYMNYFGTLEITPSWSSADSRNTLWIAFGDLDNDGDLDLAAPNRNSQQNVIYINNFNPPEPNQPPIADAGPDQTVNEGDTIQFDASASYDPDGTIETYEWDFTSDGIYDYLETSSNAPDGTFDGITEHVYGDDGVYTATLRVTDDGGESDTDSCDITVNNLNPTISAFGPYSVNEGSQLNIQGMVTDLGSDDLMFTWEWGDGTSSATTTFYNDGVSAEPVYNPSTNEIKTPLGTYPFSTADSVSHTYGDDGEYTITLTVTDDDGSEASYETTVTVNNVAPAITLMVTYPDDEGSQVTFEAEATDPGSDDLTYSWELEYGPIIENSYYNDGVDPEPFYEPITNEVKSPSGTYPFQTSDVVTHIYGDDYEYIIILTVTDDDGGESTTTSTVTVNNLAPSITNINIPANIDEGSSMAFVASAEDQGSDDLTFTWKFELGPTLTNVHYNDGISPDPDPSPQGIFPFSASDSVSHTYGDNGEFSVTLTIEDDDQGVTTYSTTVEITNVAPLIVLDDPNPVDENSPVTISGMATDSGSDDLTFTWDWGDGTSDTVTIYYNDGTNPDPEQSPGGTFPFSVEDVVSHTYGDDGVFTVTLTVEDDDDGMTAETTTVTVNNVLPSIEPDEPSFVDENSPITLTAIFTDPGSDDLTITWDWGDGFSSTITTIHFNDGISPDPYPSPEINPMSVTESQSHTYGDNGIFTVTITALDDDNGETISTVEVEVNNVAPTVESIEVFMYVNFSLRIAGEKYHSVTIHLFEDGSEIWTASVTRYPGNPDEQKATISNVRLDMTKSYTALVDYLPNDPRVNGNVWGGNPVWIDMTFEDGSTERLHHTFNVRQSDWGSDHWNHIDPWEVELKSNLMGHSIKVTSHITDPGSDDEILTYYYGSQTVQIICLNNPPNPDPYPSPEINPRDIINTATLLYEGPGTLVLTIVDDDGGAHDIEIELA